MRLFGPNIEKMRAKGDAAGLIKAVKNAKSGTLPDLVDAVVSLGPISVDPLILALKSQDMTTRMFAAKVLGKTGDTRAVEPLIAALRSKDEFLGVKSYIAEALNDIGDKRAIAPLRDCLAEVKVEMRSIQEMPMSAFASKDDPKGAYNKQLMLSIEEDISKALVSLEKPGEAQKVEPIENFPANSIQQSILTPSTVAVKPASRARLVLPNNREIPLFSNNQSLGRGDFEKVVPLENIMYISRQHLQVRPENGKYFMEDAGSANGTRVNGTDIKGRGWQELNEGDRIVLAGVVELTYRAG